MFRFQIQKELRNTWTEVLQDHANLFLSPLHGQFGSATITLQCCERNLPAPDNKAATCKVVTEAIYSCSIRITGFDTTTCDHSDPHIAIGQAMARARRSLARRARIRETVGL